MQQLGALPEPVTKGLKALSNPIRQMMLSRLMNGKTSYNRLYRYIMEKLGRSISPGHFDYHLKLLCSAGLVESAVYKKGGIRRVYRATELSKNLLDAILKVYMEAGLCPTQ